MDGFKARFVDLWQRHSFAGSDDVPVDTFNKLMKRYGDPWRNYHNFNHIQTSLAYFDACKAHAEFTDAIELAIWFHDCIFEVEASNNEARSRDWFIKCSQEYLVPALVTTVDRLIMDTCHNDAPDSIDGKLIADIDLTSFGLHWDEYLKDSEAVESEISHHGYEISSADRIAFLNNMMKDGQIYYTPYYLAHYEQQAQHNVRRQLEILKSR